MTAAIVTLAVLAAGLGVTAAALGLRIAGLRGQLGDERLLTAAEHARAEANALLLAQTAEELRQVLARYAKLEERRMAELDALAETAARCMGAAEIRRQLQLLTTPRKVVGDG